jgi:dihydroorotate dehydrogenase (fumarate)
MKKLTSHYLGLKLRSPMIVASSGLTSSIDKLKEAEDNGAGAVVLKSLFEEQIGYYASKLSGSTSYPESDDYIAYYTKSHAVEEYLNLITSAKRSLDVPVIPSINCFSASSWIDFARLIEESGADALEINVFFLPVDKKKNSTDAENLYYNLIEKLKEIISIPIAIKIGTRFSNILNVVDQFYMRGAEGVVMFNRFYEPDIDINNLEIVSSPVFSSEIERRYVLRWIAMTSAMDIKIDISASTGVNSGEDAIRYILAGANSVQVCSALYRNGISFLKEINNQIQLWMDNKGFNNIDDFKGKLNYSGIAKPSIFERTQFMRYFSSHE